MLPLHCVQPIDGSFGFGFVPSPFSSDLCGRSLALQCEATSEQLVTSGRSSYSVLCVRQELGNHRQCTVFCLTVSIRQEIQPEKGSRVGAGLCEVPTNKGSSSDPLSPDPVGGSNSVPARLPKSQGWPTLAP